MTRILIVGGYGQFGALVAERLARAGDIEIVIAGRRADAAQAAAESLARKSKVRVVSAVFDATRPDASLLGKLAPSVVINASGPFQAQDYALARAAVDVGAHYVDLADAPAFVTGLPLDRELDERARAKGLLVACGASTVPAISSAVVDRYAVEFSRLDRISIGISPGNAFDPGEATTRSILSAIGKPFAIRRNGATTTVHGWQGLRRHEFPVLGRRWMSHVHVPDVDLFPERYPQAQTIEFHAGLEVTIMHLGLWAMSWPVRSRLMGDPQALAPLLLKLKAMISFLGTDKGGMFVQLGGHDHDGRTRRICWHLIAEGGHGPYIPATPSVVIGRRLARGDRFAAGARAAVGLLSLDDVLSELADLEIQVVVA